MSGQTTAEIHVAKGNIDGWIIGGDENVIGIATDPLRRLRQQSTEGHPCVFGDGAGGDQVMEPVHGGLGLGKELLDVGGCVFSIE